jgi:hypothetical protein
MIWHSRDENCKELELQMPERVTLVVLEAQVRLADRVR